MNFFYLTEKESLYLLWTIILLTILLIGCLYMSMEINKDLMKLHPRGHRPKTKMFDFIKRGL